MITVRQAADRGHFRNDWLDSRHSFSFGEYYDPQHLGFSVLRVINDDVIAPGAGFPTHSHRDMEIITYVLEGAIAHKDSTGGVGTIRPGEVQRMSAGTGVAHSEFNPAPDKPTRMLQIWLMPEKRGVAAGYEQVTIPARKDGAPLQLIAARTGGEGAVTINQDANVYAGKFGPDEQQTLPLSAKRTAWVQVANGEIELNGTTLKTGDGAAVKNESELRLASKGAAEVLVFDLPPLPQ